VFVVFEGLDGSGTSTQLAIIGAWLGCFTTFEPTNGPIGALIREKLREGGFSNETMALLFAADRKEHNKQIKSQLEQNKTVICDRYVYSSLAYQSSIGVSMDLIKKINEDCIKPDLILYFKISAEDCAERMTSRKKDSFENIELQKKVETAYQTVLSDTTNVVYIDATKSVEDVTEQLKTVITGTLCKTTKTYVY